MAELRVGTLRIAARGAVAPDPEPLLAAIARRDADRTVLILRRLTVPRDDPATARDAVDAARRRAARPALEPVPPDADAVCFADEAEALVCLSRDLLDGTAAGRWWWAGRRPASASSAGEALAVTWMREPRWVPAVLGELEAVRPGTAARAVDALGSAAALVLAAVLDAFPQHRAGTPSAGAGGAPVHTAVAAPAPSGAGRRLVEIAALMAGMPIAQLAGEAGRDDPGEALAHELVLVAAAGAGAAGAGSSEAGPPASAPSGSPADRAAGGHDAPAADADASGPAGSPATDAAGPLAPVADLDSEREARRGARGDDDRALSPAARPRIPVWAGSGPRVDSGLASLLFAINLVGRFDLAAAAADDATGWGVVEAVGRSLLRPLEPSRRRLLAADPLFDLFADLDGRARRTPTRVRLGAAMAPVRRWLTRQGVPVDSFARPGTIVLSRTHLDVVFDLQQVDLAARVCGLDQDPGWMPELGRIVLFHFEELR